MSVIVDEKRPLELPASVQKHLRWLLHGPLRRDDGMLCGWLDENASVNPYQEATGYLIVLLGYLYKITGGEEFLAEAKRSARALAADIGDAAGCGRDSKIYLFDTCVCLRAFGLLANMAPDENLALRERLAETVASMLSVRRACDRPKDDNWSERFNVHLLKALAQARPWLYGSRIDEEFAAVFDEAITAQYRNGLFYISPMRESVYLHAHCYALEGVLTRRDAHVEVLRQAAEALAALQKPDGALPKCCPSAEPHPLAYDSTAQAVRIWQCVDPVRFAYNITQGLTALRVASSTDGGVAYGSHLKHLNSWTTIFTVQALLWQHATVEPEWLV